MAEPERRPTLDYQTPEAVTWRHTVGSVLVNTLSIGLHCVLVLALILWCLRAGIL
jgi:hypothetical protein